MKQYEAVIKVMEGNGGFATLGLLYQEALKIPGVSWTTKTPFANIRRIVQDDRFFYKIRPGLWALNEYKTKLPQHMQPAKSTPTSTQEVFTHTYYQGLLVEIGNLKNFETFVPNQDKNRIYLNKTLGAICTLQSFYEFGYQHLVRRAKTVDVSWFNSRRMPNRLFEIEHSTDIQNSLLKFMELQDFNTSFFVVANNARKTEYKTKLAYSAFEPIAKRVQFMDYDQLSEWHTKTYEISLLETSLSL